MVTNRNNQIVSGTLPETYREVLNWKVTDKKSRLVIALALAVVGFLIFGLVFTGLAMVLGGLPPSGTFVIDLGSLIPLFVGVVVTLIVHELVHGLAMSLFGAKPRYGILWKGLMLYATSPGFAFSRNAYVLILMAPFVVISALVVLGLWLMPGMPWSLTVVTCGVVNASGAAGDLWMTLIALRYPALARIMDERDGLRVFLPQIQTTGLQAAPAPDPLNPPGSKRLRQRANP